MALMGVQKTGSAHWFREHRGAFPSIAGLLAYVGLAVVAVSIIMTTLALNDLVRRYSRDGARR